MASSARFILGTVLLLGLVWVWVSVSGPVFWWDWAHYHHYVGYQWLSGRFAQGFMPAGGQTFFNPLGYVPAFWLAQQGVTPFAVAMISATWHALALGAIALIACELVRTSRGPVAWAVPVCVVYAWATPVFLDVLGTSSIDPSTAVGVLWGVACALRARRTGAMSWIAWAGLALGAAVGLKLSNAVPAVCLPILWLWPASSHPHRVGALDGRSVALPWLRGSLVYWMAGGIGFALAHGAWGFELYRLTGNPFYPFLGTIFSPHGAVDAGTAPVATASLTRWWQDLWQSGGGRFVPTSWRDFFSFPWDMANPSRLAYPVYLEWRSPDPRPLIWLVLGAWILVRYKWLRRRVANSAERPIDTASPDAARALWALALVWGGAWVVTSGNGRYGLPWLMLLSVLVVHSVWVGLSPGRLRRMVLLTIVGVQLTFALILSERGEIRPELTWQQAPSRPEVPQILREQPWLHVTVMAMSWSYLAPYVHQGSAWANTFASCEGCGGPSDQRNLQRLLTEWSGRARLLVPYDEQRGSWRGLSQGWQDYLNVRLADYDLRIDPQECVVVSTYPGLVETLMVEYHAQQHLVRKADGLVSCALREAPSEAAQTRRQRGIFDDVFSRLEHTCGGELGAPTGASQWDGQKTWQRQYARREVRVTIKDDQVVLTAYRRRSEPWGTVAAWRSATPPDCAAVQAMTRPAASKPFELPDLGAPGEFVFSPPAP